MGGEQQLRGDLHLQLIFSQFEDGEILQVPFMVGHSPLVPVVSFKQKDCAILKMKQNKSSEGME